MTDGNGGTPASTVARTAIKRLSALSDRVVRPPSGVTVLIYHRVGGGSASAVDLDAAVFDDHLARLADHHRVLSLDDALVELTSTNSAPTPAVVLTCDDGTADFCDVVVPALVRHGLPITLYVATRFVDGAEDFPWGAPPTSWSALRDAAATGLVTIGSHTHSHWLLDRLDPAAIDDDLDRSIDLIGEHLGIAAAHFAYPKAVAGSPAAEVAVRRRFRSASLAGSRVNRPGATDLHRLWRTPVQRSDTADMFEAKARGGMRLEGELRSLAARLRYRGATR
jgi:peptidoglycan/xylan/chitin deacetylase (PgdA/CDA1 family)